MAATSALQDSTPHPRVFAAFGDAALQVTDIRVQIEGNGLAWRIFGTHLQAILV